METTTTPRRSSRLAAKSGQLSESLTPQSLTKPKLTKTKSKSTTPTPTRTPLETLNTNEDRRPRSPSQTLLNSPSPLKKKVPTHSTHPAVVWLRTVSLQLENMRPEDIKSEIAESRLITEGEKTDGNLNAERKSKLLEDTEQTIVKVNVDLYKKLFDCAALCKTNGIAEGAVYAFKVVECLLQLRIKRVYKCLLRTHIWDIARILDDMPEQKCRKHLSNLQNMHPKTPIPLSQSLYELMEHVLHVSYILECILVRSFDDKSVILSGLHLYHDELMETMMDSVRKEKIVTKTVEMLTGSDSLQANFCLRFLTETIPLLFKYSTNIDKVIREMDRCDLFGAVVGALSEPTTDMQVVLSLLLECATNSSCRGLLLEYVELSTQNMFEIILNTFARIGSVSQQGIFREFCLVLMTGVFRGYTYQHTMASILAWERLFDAFTHLGIHVGSKMSIVYDVLSDITHHLHLYCHDSADAHVQLINKMNFSVVEWLQETFSPRTTYSPIMICSALHLIRRMLEFEHCDRTLKTLVTLNLIPRIQLMKAEKRLPEMIRGMIGEVSRLAKDVDE